ncbi:FAD:protein FMN transferase [Desertivirga xinjiangensis]|uniref:FAD:protein FMN transferase n=1 Tax=Desertivirga xinjiangensis TaxID=539206 RepID=UPI00210B63F2|nr:FAD:protein FMN transferase [Pedobacter xinjiangensis]
MLKYLLSIIIIALLSFNKKAEISRWRITGYAQGTTYSITYYAEDSLVSRSEVDDILNGIDSSLSIYKSYSLINTINNSERGGEADKHLKAVVNKSLEVYKETGGAFDITVFPLVRAWGFGTKSVSILPNADTIKSILPCVGSDKIYLDQGRLIKTNPCVKIDVNGIAQGYSVDKLADYLERKKINNYLVEIGGEIRVKGRKFPENQPMSIGIEAPAKSSTDEQVIQKVIQINKGAVTTSGNYRKYVKNGNKKLSHLIDPKTGYPLDNELISVTVIADDAISADAYDNALMGMGLKKAMQFAKDHKLEAYFIYYNSKKQITDTATTGFYTFIRN